MIASYNNDWSCFRLNKRFDFDVQEKMIDYGESFTSGVFLGCIADMWQIQKIVQYSKNKNVF